MQSGYCECENGVKTAISHCHIGRAPFNCNQMCASEAKVDTNTYGLPDPNITLNSANTPGTANNICRPHLIHVPLSKRQFNSQKRLPAPFYAATVYNKAGELIVPRCLDSQLKGPGSWCSYENDAYHLMNPLTGSLYGKEGGVWYLLETDRTQLIVGIVTKGRGDAEQWVTSYIAETVNHEGDPFMPVDNGRIFNANTDQDTPVTNYFFAPVKAFLLKMYPHAWHGHMSFRIEILGCKNEISRCGDIVGANECLIHKSSSGGSYYYAPGFATDDRLGKVPEGPRGGKAIDYPLDPVPSEYGVRGLAGEGYDSILIGRGVSLDECGKACDSNSDCEAFTIFEHTDPQLGQCWLQKALDGTAVDWKRFGVFWTTYYKADNTQTNLVVPPQGKSSAILGRDNT